MSTEPLGKKIPARFAARMGIPPASPIPKADPDMAQVAHFVHAMAGASPAVRELVRRYSRKNYGELPPEASLPPLPDLPKRA